MTRVPVVILALSATFLLGSLRTATGSDGKSVFLAKCQLCHSVNSQAIASHGFAAGMIDWSRQCRGCNADLSDVEKRRKADWLKAYLRNEKKGRNGLKHNEVPLTQDGKALIMKFGASEVPYAGPLGDDELEALVEWLTMLKASSPVAPADTGASKGVEVTPSNAQAVALPREETDKVLRSAQTVAIIGQAGKQMMDRAMWNPDSERARRKVTAVISEWARYTLVERAEDADLVLVVTEFQKNINLLRRANLVAEMRVYRGGQPPSADTPVVWSGDAAEGFSQPATKVAEKFRDFVKALPQR
jgi:hypothetical protein